MSSMMVRNNSSPMSTMQRNQNNEGITLIWYNSKIERKQMITIDELREVNDYVLYLSGKEECINYITSVKTERILFVITCESCPLIILPQAHTLHAIDSIFIFCSELSETTHHCQLEEYDRKVIGVFHERCELIDSIKKIVNFKTNQMPTFSFYNYNYEKSIRDLTKEPAEFLWFHMFKDIILQMPRDTQAKQQLIDFCRSYYYGNKQQLESIDYFEQTYPETSNAIQWYTKSSFVYKLINKALRTENIELLYILRFFISDLSLSLTTAYKQKMIDQQCKINEVMLTLYRGCQLSDNEFERVQQNIGGLISTNGFLSTSRSKNVALIFAGTSEDDNYYNILFEIECNLNDFTIFADISAYSHHPDEEEFLFDFGATFKIVSIEKEKNFQVWIIKIKATDEGTNLTKEYIELNRKENNEISVMIVFGKLLIDMGKFDQAQKYFETILLNNLQQQQEDVAMIYNSLGTIYYSKGELDIAFQNYQRAYDLMICSNPPRIRDSAKPLNNMGAVMYGKKHFNRALESYFKVLTIEEQFFGKECLTAANTLLNIGLIYEEEKDFHNSLNYYQKALEIQRKLLPNDHVNIATSLNNIGSMYQRKREYNYALEYYQQALKMRQKLLPEEHDDIAESFHNIGEILDSQGQLDKALEYYFKAVEIREKIYGSSNGHVNLAMTLRNIGTIYECQTDYIHAIEYYERALKMNQCLSITSNDYSEISKLNNYIARVRRQMNE